VRRDIAIIGAGVAGLTAAETLRRGGYRGGLGVFGQEAATPYERPTLSKGFLLDAERDDPTPLLPPAALAELGLTLELGVEVVALDLPSRTLLTAAGEEVPYERLLLAPGAEPRRLELEAPPLAGVHRLRSVADARALRTELRAGGRVAIVGGGVVGLETAASATALGCTVTVIEAGAQILGRLGPAAFARLIEQEHRRRGVVVGTGSVPIGLEGARGRVTGVVLGGGGVVPASTVVIGVGAVPRTDLAARAGLAVEDGIVVDERFRSSDRHVYAAGDAARVLHAIVGEHVRLEQWWVAQEQGRHAAESMLGRGEPYRDVPWMWSDQHDLHLQATGFGFAGAEVVERGSLEERTGVVFFGVRDGRLVAACGASRGTGVAKTIRVAQLLIQEGAAVEAERLVDPTFNLRRLARAAAA
jgi:3-phenylpropionate/trans-cinnamate dioxygenase ferredoxin reductase subunit